MARPRLSESERRLTKSVKLTPAEVAFLEGRGGVSRGLHDLLARAMEAMRPRRRARRDRRCDRCFRLGLHLADCTACEAYAAARRKE
jgi:hypothetical protein